MLVSETFSHQEVRGFKFGYNPLGKPVLYSHVYFVDGLLIDTGHIKIKESFLKRTQNLDVQKVFITHHHEDHTGNLQGIKEQKEVEIFCSPLCQELMKNPPDLSLAQKLTWGDRPPFYDFTTIEDKIETINHRFEIIPIPGHAKDMVALYERDKKWLFSADLYINSFIGYFLENESIQDQINSTKRILELDFEAMFCAHNPQFKNPKAKLAKKLDFLESSFEAVKNLHNQGLNPKQIFDQLPWKEDWFIRFLSGGQLSKFNMVKSIVRDIESK